MKARNPKSEIRKKPKAQKPKLEGLKSSFSIPNDYALAETIQSGGDEINAKTQRRKGVAWPNRNQIFLDCGGKRSATPLWKLYPLSKSGVAAALCHRNPKPSRRKMILRYGTAKRMRPDQFCSLNSDRGRPAGEPFFLCVFAPLRLCVEISLNTYGLGQRALSDLPIRLIANS
jgi:hypothetical protein